VKLTAIAEKWPCAPPQKRLGAPHCKYSVFSRLWQGFHLQAALMADASHALLAIGALRRSFVPRSDHLRNAAGPISGSGPSACSPVIRR
jgi:hypothetical protein